MQFQDLNLIDPLLRAISAEGYTEPTPIQLQAIPHVLNQRDLIGCAQTGTGKTAAFALPILQRLSEMSQNRKRGVIRAVATPGRLLDLLNQGVLTLSSVEHLVLDEADRMLDMGFLPDVKRILAKLPAARQSLLFSATMPPDIKALADRMLRDPAHVAAAPVATTADRIEERLYHVARSDKTRLVESLLRDPRVLRALVFTRTKHGANRVASQLCRAGIESLAIHGNKSQSARTRALDAFKSGEAPVLVATDIAARGIDVDGISHVVNFDLPNVPESYVHRIGRTARAGASGIAISLCDADERTCLRDIERLIRVAPR
jgi:ATP-dependent RNA helicase RhlE